MPDYDVSYSVDLFDMPDAKMAAETARRAAGEVGGSWFVRELYGDTSETVELPEPTVAGVLLSPKQQETVEFFQAYNVPAQWFVGTKFEAATGRVEVIALGENFVWSFIIEPDGEASSSEAKLGEFSTGINV